MTVPSCTKLGFCLCFWLFPWSLPLFLFFFGLVFFFWPVQQWPSVLYQVFCISGLRWQDPSQQRTLAEKSNSDQRGWNISTAEYLICWLLLAVWLLTLVLEEPIQTYDSIVTNATPASLKDSLLSSAVLVGRVSRWLISDACKPFSISSKFSKQHFIRFQPRAFRQCSTDSKKIRYWLIERFFLRVFRWSFVSFCLSSPYCVVYM